MMSASAPRVVVLLLLWPVSAIFCLSVYETVESTMNELELNGNTLCPFTSHNVTTGGIPETVPEYRCVTNKMSEKVGHSLRRCMKGRGCVQGTSTIMIRMSDHEAPVARKLFTGCFCVSQTASSPRTVAKPLTDGSDMSSSYDNRLN